MKMFEKRLEDCPVLVQNNIWLKPYHAVIDARIKRFEKRCREIETVTGDLLTFANMHTYLGLNYDAARQGWYYREWAPAAHALYLIGDFNGWKRYDHPLYRNEYGIWEIFLSDADYAKRFTHGSKFKVLVRSAAGELERIPAYIRRVVQDPVTHDFAAQHWHPEKPFDWTGDTFRPSQIDQLLIYECHVGMAQEKEAVGTWNEFTEYVLPRVKAGGYTAIQLMAVQEHPYYGSFGYHVSNFFAPSSRFGTPEDLKTLIKTAHGLGIAVIMDIVHSHAVKNVYEGLSLFDGTDYQYFHAGYRGVHPAWDSKLFDYGKWEVQQFLLSNVRYWIEEFHFDGFRFDGVTSMLYHHHGGTSFDNLDKYFDLDVDNDAITYLQMANTVAHTLKPDFISIAEDVSGMPGLCRPTLEGGIGFDYRLAMGIPDYWIKMLKTRRDEDWDIGEMWAALTNRPATEKVIAYAESHDQAMVGDKTIAFWLMDKEMYYGMQELDPNPAVERGIALHKLIRFATITLGGDGYLTFMGNEFGHPEWIDFPREGNRWSYKYARRQWSLADNPFLKYKWLLAFDKAMTALVHAHKLFALPIEGTHYDHPHQVLGFMRGDLFFVFCFHPIKSTFDYQVRVPYHGKYELIFSTDDKLFGGHARTAVGSEHFSNAEGYIRIYCTQRSAFVFRHTDKEKVRIAPKADTTTDIHQSPPQGGHDNTEVREDNLTDADTLQAPAKERKKKKKA